MAYTQEIIIRDESGNEVGRYEEPIESSVAQEVAAAREAKKEEEARVEQMRTLFTGLRDLVQNWGGATMAQKDQGLRAVIRLSLENSRSLHSIIGEMESEEPEPEPEP